MIYATILSERFSRGANRPAQRGDRTPIVAMVGVGVVCVDGRLCKAVMCRGGALAGIKSKGNKDVVASLILAETVVCCWRGVVFGGSSPR